MKQNNISTQKGRRVFSRKMLFFLFLILAVIALFLGLNLKRYTDRERKQGNIEKEITTEKEKTSVRKLHKKYKDMIGWLEIKGTGFSYPVMQTGMKGHHPDDWQYYLQPHYLRSQHQWQEILWLSAELPGGSIFYEASGVFLHAGGWERGEIPYHICSGDRQICGLLLIHGLWQ